MGLGFIHFCIPSTVPVHTSATPFWCTTSSCMKLEECQLLKRLGLSLNIQSLPQGVWHKTGLQRVWFIFSASPDCFPILSFRTRLLHWHCVLALWFPPHPYPLAVRARSSRPVLGPQSCQCLLNSEADSARAPVQCWKTCLEHLVQGNVPAAG